MTTLSSTPCTAFSSLVFSPLVVLDWTHMPSLQSGHYFSWTHHRPPFFPSFCSTLTPIVSFPLPNSLQIPPAAPRLIMSSETAWKYINIFTCLIINSLSVPLSVCLSLSFLPDNNFGKSKNLCYILTLLFLSPGPDTWWIFNKYLLN